MRYIRRTAALTVTLMLIVLVFPVRGLAAYDLSAAEYPSWYKFESDRFSFNNIVETVPERFYTDMFGMMKGRQIYGMYESGRAHGLCYGLSLACASFFAEQDAVRSYRSFDDRPYERIVDLKKGSLSDDSGISLESYIKYCYAFQASCYTCEAYFENVNQFDALRQAVYEFVHNNGAPVIIGLLGQPVSHEVLAVGLSGEDIVVNDSNAPDDLQVIDFTGNSWTYECAGFSWNNKKADMDFSTDAVSVFHFVNSSAGNTEAPSGYLYSSFEEDLAFSDIFIRTDERVDRDKLLVLFSGDDFFCNESENLSELGSADVSVADQSYDMNFYWLQDGHILSGENFGDETVILSAFLNNIGVSVFVYPGEKIRLALSDESGILVDYIGKNGDAADVVLHSLDHDGHWVNCIIKGTMKDHHIRFSGFPEALSVIGLDKMEFALTGEAFGEADRGFSPDAKDLTLSFSPQELLSGLSVFPVDKPYIMGDCNSDGQVTSADARLALRSSVGLSLPENFSFEKCDVEINGYINTADARLILRNSVGLDALPFLF